MWLILRTLLDPIVHAIVLYHILANWSLLATLERGLSLRVSGDTPASPEVSLVLLRHLCPRSMDAFADFLKSAKSEDALSRAATLVRHFEQTCGGR